MWFIALSFIVEFRNKFSQDKFSQDDNTSIIGMLLSCDVMPAKDIIELLLFMSDYFQELLVSSIKIQIENMIL